jgi:hypothetical protein
MSLGCSKVLSTEMKESRRSPDSRSGAYLVFHVPVGDRLQMNLLLSYMLKARHMRAAISQLQIFACRYCAAQGHSINTRLPRLGRERGTLTTRNLGGQINRWKVFGCSSISSKRCDRLRQKNDTSITPGSQRVSVEVRQLESATRVQRAGLGLHGLDSFST